MNRWLVEEQCKCVSRALANGPFPLTPSFVKSTMEGQPALFLGQREHQGSIRLRMRFMPLLRIEDEDDDEDEDDAAPGLRHSLTPTLSLGEREFYRSFWRSAYSWTSLLAGSVARGQILCRLR
jgi:hypothetical protein